MVSGRLTKYHEGMPQMVLDYLEETKDSYEKWIKSDGANSTSYQHQIKVKLPTIDGVSTYLGIHLDTVWAWKKKHSLFSDALDCITKEQKERLLDKGLSGEYNANIAKFILASNHGMSDATNVNLGGQKDNPVSVVDFSKYEPS